MKLYITFRSPYARKVRIALQEKGIAYEEINIDLLNKPQDFIENTTVQTVPTLVISPQLVLSDSTLILQYIEKNFIQKSLLPHDPEKYWQTWVWEDYADRLCEYFIAVFFEKQRALPEQKVLHKAQQMQERIFQKLNVALEKQQFILGEFSLADIAMASVLKWIQFRLNDCSLAESPIILNWQKQLEERPSFKNTFPKLDV